MSVTAGVSVSYSALTVRDKLRGKIESTKVKRYWPGKAPERADDVDEDAGISTARTDEAFPSNSVPEDDDPRLRRLLENRLDDRDRVRADHRRIRQAEIVSTIEEDNRLDEDEDEEALEEKRRAMKEKMRLNLKNETVLLSEEEEEEEEELEYATDSDEETTGISMVKLVFVLKSERGTIAERERLEAEERAIEEMVKKRKEERKLETKEIVVKEICKDEEIQRVEANIVDVDTDDELNEAEEYEAWKVREIGRIKRDRDAREAMPKEREEIDEVRNMTEEERKEWERRNPKPAPPPKQKRRYLQRHYHKGAFFQNDPDDVAGTSGSDEIFSRDFSAPTGEDKTDKSMFPKVMQVKHFGRRGRTKWTHLVNEDTTDWNNPWNYNDSLRAKYNAKMAGTKPIEKPKGSKTLKRLGNPLRTLGNVTTMSIVYVIPMEPEVACNTLQ